MTIFGERRGGFNTSKGNKKSQQDKAMTREELHDLLGYAKSDLSSHGKNAYALFFIAGNYGLRCSEVLDLKFTDFDSLRQGYFRVRTVKRRGRQEDRVYIGKKGLAPLLDLLKERERSGNKKKLFNFGDRTARYLFAYYAQTAGISANVSFHALRHSAARMLLDSLKNSDLAHKGMGIVNCFLRHEPDTDEIYTYPSHDEMMYAMDRKPLIS